MGALRVLGLLLALAAVGATAPGAGAAAREPHPQGGVSWIILGKLKGKKKFAVSPGSVLTIHTDNVVAGLAPAVPEANPATAATGNIVVGLTDGTHCKCANHFHGTLFGIADPDPNGCGWGCAVPVAEATPEIQTVARAADYGYQALAILQEHINAETDPPIGTILDLLDSCMDELETLLPPELAAKKKKNKFQDTLQFAISTVNDSYIELDTGSGDLIFAALNLDNGLRLHVDLLKLLKPKIPKAPKP